MKIIDFSWKNTIFVRMVIMLILFFIPVYAVGLIIYNWGVDTVREEISNSMQTQVNNFMTNMERDVQRIQTLQFNSITDENLFLLGTIPGSMNVFERSRAVLRLQQHLNAIMNSNANISNVIAYIPLSEMIISPQSIEGEIKDVYNRIDHSPSNIEAPINITSNKLILTAQYPLPYTKNNTVPVYVVQIEIGKKELENSLQQMSNKEVSGSILLDPKGSMLITNRLENPVLLQIMAALKTDFSLKKKNGSESIKVDGKRYMVFYTASDYLGMVVSQYISEDQVFNKLNQYVFWFRIFTALVIAIMFLFAFSTYKTVHRPLIKLVRSFRKVENGNFNLRILHQQNDEFKYLYNRFNMMVANLSILIDQVYKEKILAQRAELKHLQSQINPHFLYNSFFGLYQMVESEDYENVSIYTRQLGSYFQFITRSVKDDIPLSMEIDHARVFSALQARRFRNRLRVEFDELPDKFNDIPVPRLIIQPILENVFEHGLKNKLSDGLLRVYFASEPNKLSIYIEDNGDEINEEYIAGMKQLLLRTTEDQEYTGMINTHRRIQLKFGASCGLSVSRGDLGGLKVKIAIREGEEDNVSIADRG